MPFVDPEGSGQYMVLCRGQDWTCPLGTVDSLPLSPTDHPDPGSSSKGRTRPVVHSNNLTMRVPVPGLSWK